MLSSTAANVILKKLHRACSNAVNQDNKLRREIKVNKLHYITGFFNSLVMLIRYARVSTDDQNPNLQEDALQATGCENIIINKVN